MILKTEQKIIHLKKMNKTNNNEKTLIVITGPTAVGKTQASIDIAKKLNTDIISADARQFYKELKIGTAPPSSNELEQVKHYFISHISINTYYNAYMFENEALDVIYKLFNNKDFIVLTGGSGLYIDAVCKGIDFLPYVDSKTRNEVKEIYNTGGLDALRQKLLSIDPEYYKNADLANPKRIMRAIEVFFASGQKLSQLHSQNKPKQRNFKVKRIILNRPREELFDRINKRTDEMIKQGLVEEARDLYKCKDYNALNTVGYKELFKYFQNEYSLDLAIEKIKTNTRRYAKRQLTWFKKYEDAIWLDPDNKSVILHTAISGTNKNSFWVK